MKELFLLLAATFLLCLSAKAQDEEATAAERSRIESERSQAEATFRVQEKMCYQKFAVTGCLNKAKAQRRAALADLRRQELSLNDELRKRKGAEHLADIEERAAEKQQGTADRTKAASNPNSRQDKTAQKAADRAASEAARVDQAARRQQQLERKKAEDEAARHQKAAEAEVNAKKFRQRQAEAQEHQTNLDKRLTEQNKPAPQPLPLPP